MQRLTRRATTLLAAGMITSLMVPSAMAQETAEVTQSVTGGSLSATASDLGLTAVNYAHTDQTSSGNVALTVDDSRGTGEGWNVSVMSSGFAYTDDSSAADPTHDLDASNFALTSATTPVAVEGQGVDGTDGPKVVTGTGTLDQARTVVDANVDFGQGKYTQSLGVALTVPGQARAGTYTGTLTITATSGPSGTGGV